MDDQTSLNSSEQPFSVPSKSEREVSDQWLALLNTVQTFSVPKTSLTLPWETGFAALVFGGSSSSTSVPSRMPFVPIPPVLPQSIPGKDTSTTAQQSVHDRPGAWPVVCRRIDGLTWDDRKGLARSRALCRIKSFFQHSPEATGLGRTLLKDILALESEAYLNKVISDILSRKATKTLEKRARSLTSYALFCALHKECPLPINESMVYRFMSEHCVGSSSKAQQLSEALNFCKDTLQVDGVEQATASPRVKGFCFRQGLTKRLLKQADVLTVLMVIALESILLSDKEFLPDRIFAGHCLACTHGRFRWSDALSIVQIAFDLDQDGNGFVQAEGFDVKTATNVSKKRTFLPMTALAWGISTNTWAQTWMS